MYESINNQQSKWNFTLQNLTILDFNIDELNKILLEDFL
jgi:hypothetical protein